MTINETQYAEESITACDSYAWNGETYTASGDYVYTTTAANGCDSIVTLHFTITSDCGVLLLLTIVDGQVEGFYSITTLLGSGGISVRTTLGISGSMPTPPLLSKVAIV